MSLRSVSPGVGAWLQPCEEIGHRLAPCSRRRATPAVGNRKKQQFTHLPAVWVASAGRGSEGVPCPEALWSRIFETRDSHVGFSAKSGLTWEGRSQRRRWRYPPHPPKMLQL